MPPKDKQNDNEKKNKKEKKKPITVDEAQIPHIPRGLISGLKSKRDALALMVTVNKLAHNKMKPRGIEELKSGLDKQVRDEFKVHDLTYIEATSKIIMSEYNEDWRREGKTEAPTTILDEYPGRYKQANTDG